MYRVHYCNPTKLTIKVILISLILTCCHAASWQALARPSAHSPSDKCNAVSARAQGWMYTEPYAHKEMVPGTSSSGHRVIHMNSFLSNYTYHIKRQKPRVKDLHIRLLEQLLYLPHPSQIPGTCWFTAELRSLTEEVPFPPVSASQGSWIF